MLSITIIIIIIYYCCMFIKCDKYEVINASVFLHLIIMELLLQHYRIVYNLNIIEHLTSNIKSKKL